MTALLAAPFAHGKSMVDTIKKAALSGAASAPTEFAVKAVSGLNYSAACPPAVQSTIERTHKQRDSEHPGAD